MFVIEAEPTSWVSIRTSNPQETFGFRPGPVVRRVLAVIKLTTEYHKGAIAKDGLMEINGVAHTFITAGDFAAARAFYRQLLPFLGLTVVADTVNTFYCVGGRTGFGI